MSNIYFCPRCFSVLKEVTGCGAVSYFCDTCKTLVSKSAMLTEEELKSNDSQNKDTE